LLYATDPFLGPHFAAGLLIAFKKNGWIDDLDETVFVTPGTDETLAHAPWTVGCRMYAFPGVTHTEFRGKIASMFTTGGGGIVDAKIAGTTKAYGLLHARMLDDVLLLSTGRLHELLETDLHWAAGVPVRHYFATFTTCFPALHDSLRTNFSYVLVASTVAEVSFSWSTKQGHANSSDHSVNRNINFYGNVRGPIIRAMQSGLRERGSRKRGREETDEESTPMRRLCRNKEERFHFLHQVFELGCTFNADDALRLSKQEARVKASKKIQLVKRFPHVMAELAKNTKSKRLGRNLESLKNVTGRYNCSWLAAEDVLPVDPIHPYKQCAKDTRWNVAAKRRYLCENELTLDRNSIKEARLHPTDADSEDYVTIVDMLENYWVRIELDESLLEGIVLKWKDSVDSMYNETIGSYAQGSMHRAWKSRHIKDYLTRNANSDIVKALKKARMKRKDDDYLIPAYYTSPELLELYWTGQQIAVTELNAIIELATTDP
jgi:hypothetical protein